MEHGGDQDLDERQHHRVREPAIVVTQWHVHIVRSLVTEGISRLQLRRGAPPRRGLDRMCVIAPLLGLTLTAVACSKPSDISARATAMPSDRVSAQSAQSAQGTRHGAPIEPRDTLFGDVPLASWVSHAQLCHEPWGTFAQAHDAIAAGRSREAVDRLQKIVAMPDLESRQYLEAWHALRGLGVAAPAEEAKRVLGVVVEMTSALGVDYVAAYADHSARYLNWSGAAVFWDERSPKVNAEIDAVLAAGAAIVRQIGPWEESRRPPPPTDHARINILTPSGLHFGEGPMDDLARDGMGGPVISAALKLMQTLMVAAMSAPKNKR
jgi:hypothetical protein